MVRLFPDNCLYPLLCLLLAADLFSQSHLEYIRPYPENPRYWQYQDAPVLLLGATKNDNLFQEEHLVSHLDSLASIGGNYIRNTMSDRDAGDLRAFAKTDGGKYDLNTWNTQYWGKFTELLNLCEARNIIVQIEIWDRFDHSREPWLSDPYHPANNVNYSYAESGLDSLYPDHPNDNKQPFFYSVPNLDHNEVLLKYQCAFVKKLLSISLSFPNVLYCIDNETSADPAWATYWAEYIRTHADGTAIYLTEMWDHWNVNGGKHSQTYDYPDRYDYIDISQNSHVKDKKNWENAQQVFARTSRIPRPINSVKIYGNDKGKWAEQYGRGSDHAVHTFFRNIIGGFASSRFHRPPSGLGLSERSANAIKSIREIEQFFPFWEATPTSDLIVKSDGDAFVTSCAEEKYLLYFPMRGKLVVELPTHPNGNYLVDRISPHNAVWQEKNVVLPAGVARLSCDQDEGCLVLIRQN